MIEQNKDILQRAINRLPNYEAPQAVWRQLDHQLEGVRPTALLEQLPIYSPPSEVWNQINKRLAQANQAAKRQTQIKPIYSNWLVRGASVAAAVLLFSAGYFFCYLAAGTHCKYCHSAGARI